MIYIKWVLEIRRICSLCFRELPFRPLISMAKLFVFMKVCQVCILSLCYLLIHSSPFVCLAIYISKIIIEWTILIENKRLLILMINFVNNCLEIVERGVAIPFLQLRLLQEWMFMSAKVQTMKDNCIK